MAYLSQIDALLMNQTTASIPLSSLANAKMHFGRKEMVIKNVGSHTWSMTLFPTDHQRSVSDSSPQTVDGAYGALVIGPFLIEDVNMPLFVEPHEYL